MPLSPDEDRRLRDVEARAKQNLDDIANLKRRVGELEHKDDDRMKAITRHVDQAVTAGIAHGLAPLASIPPRVDALERETAKQTPIIQSTHDAVLSYQAAEKVRHEGREDAKVTYENKWKRWQVLGAIFVPILLALAGLIGAAIGSQPHH